MKTLNKAHASQYANRSIDTRGLASLYNGNHGQAGQLVVVKMGHNWGGCVGETFIARILRSDEKGITVSCVEGRFPDRDDTLSSRWAYVDRSRFYRVPDSWLSDADEPEAPPAPETATAGGTLFAVMCEYDTALASLQALKPGYDAAHKRFTDARVALGLELAKHKDL